MRGTGEPEFGYDFIGYDMEEISDREFELVARLGVAI